MVVVDVPVFRLPSCIRASAVVLLEIILVVPEVSGKKELPHTDIGLWSTGTGTFVMDQ